MEHSDKQYIVAQNITHTYPDGTRALDDISFELGVGLFGLLGANGAGKSTLMRIICTLLEPSSGQASVGGYDVVKARREVRQRLGYLPQEFGAWRLQRVGEVLDTLACLSGLREVSRRRQRVEEVLGLVGLSEVAGRKVSHLSGGMLRRLGVAQALVHEPAVLVMDEPTIGLDPEERLRFRQLMATLSQERAILLSTHIVADLGASCSTVVLIHGGRLEFSGPPSALIAQAAGQVLEVPVVGASTEATLPASFEVVARGSQGGQSVLRGVSRHGEAPEGARPATQITLEEAYVAFTLSQGREVDDRERA